MTLPLGVNRNFGKHIRVQIYQFPLPEVIRSPRLQCEDVCAATSVNRNFGKHIRVQIYPISVTGSHPFSATADSTSIMVGSGE